MKIAICVPHYGDVKAQFALSLAGVLIHAGRHGISLSGEVVRPELTVFMHTGARIEVNREKLAEKALEADSDYLLWLDADQTFPSETLAQLMLHMAKVRVVGCNIVRRMGPPTPTAIVRAADGTLTSVYTTAEAAEARQVEQVHFMGFGVCLMAADVLRSIDQPWFAAHEAGEDAYFFEKLYRAKIPAFVDHNLSWRVGHIGERVLTHADAVQPA